MNSQRFKDPSFVKTYLKNNRETLVLFSKYYRKDKLHIGKDQPEVISLRKLQT